MVQSHAALLTTRPNTMHTPASTTLNSTDLAWRILALVNLFRLLLPLVILVVAFTFDEAPFGQIHPALLAGALTGYFLFASAAILSIRNRWPALTLQGLAQALTDIAVISAIIFCSSSIGGGFAAMLVLPIGAIALVTPPRFGLFLAAIGALALLAVQVAADLLDQENFNGYTNAGLIGALLLVVVWGVAPLARRLRESEALIQQRDFDIANLAELNDFIVQHLRESILVVDENDCIRLINESAGQLLKGATVPADALLGEISPRLLYLLDTWRLHGRERREETEPMVAAGGATIIQPHFVSLDPESRGPTLIFLEDTSVIAERLQQSKLAALGRLSASIAHEVRNPVGAMSHAAQLLRESPSLAPQDRRLIDIITSNGERVSQIIDNILQLSRREAIHPERFDLNAWAREFANEFRGTLQIDADSLLMIECSQPLDVRVDASHLRQIVWNLCENALRHGVLAERPAPMELRVGRIASTSRPYLEVADRGSGIAAVDIERIFEPFFTTGNGGTGLGLFIARELAHANGAILLYEPAPGGGSIFRLVFSDPQRWELQ